MELLHVTSNAAWQAALTAGQHAPPELERDGFLHCCTITQLAFVLSRHFADAADVLVIRFESDDVLAEVVWVESEPDQPPFPHLYGPIPCGAVLGVSRRSS